MIAFEVTVYAVFTAIVCFFVGKVLWDPRHRKFMKLHGEFKAAKAEMDSLPAGSAESIKALTKMIELNGEMGKLVR